MCRVEVSTRPTERLNDVDFSNATSLLLFLEWGRHFRRGITQNNSGENFTLTEKIRGGTS